MIEFEHPRVTDARAAGGHRVWLRFTDGVEGTADLSDLLDGPVFGPLRDPARFAQLRLDPPFTISWPNGADIAPEALYERVQATGGVAKRNWTQLFDAAMRDAAAQCAAMPELSRFYGIIIRMSWNEHGAPHFHAQFGEFIAAVEIDSGAVTTRRFPETALRLVQDWRRLHLHELRDNWDRLSRREVPVAIPPLA